MRATNRSTMIMIIFFLIRNVRMEPKSSCKTVSGSHASMFHIAQARQRSNADRVTGTEDIEEPCDFPVHYANELVPCVDENLKNVTEKIQCVANLKCCWDEHNDRCFLKPKKCYVDLRRERCFSRVRITHGIEGIYTGYSANGSHCFVPSLNVLPESYARVVGSVRGYGFPIVTSPADAVCGERWEIRVAKNEVIQSKCSVTIFNVTNSSNNYLSEEQVYGGELRFGNFCILNTENFDYYFDYDGNEKRHHQCICRVVSWLESAAEDVPVSDDVKNYVKRLENRTTCTQILGMFIRSSWMRILSLENEEEAEEVMDALVKLTRDSNELNFHDIEVFINSTTKVADYSFYNGVEKKSADDLMKKTAFMASHVIESLMENSAAPKAGKVAAIYGENKETKPHLRKHSYPGISDEESKLKYDLFKTVDLMAERIASRVQNLNNESEFLLRVPEKHIDLSLAVTKNSSALQRRMHHSNFSNTKDDVITVLKIPNDTMPISDEENVAVISVFYDYPVSEKDENKRISNYLTVNVWKLGLGENREISVPVHFTLTRTNSKGRQWAGKPTCSFLVSNDSREVWSDFGCSTENSIHSNTTTCVCNHTTNFAILMKVSGSDLPDEHSEALKIVSVVLGLLSLASLIATIFIFIVYRKTLLKERMIIHFHLIIALFFGYVSILPTSLLASETAEYPSFLCIASAVLTHYFYLAVFFWSLVEGVYIFFKIVLVFKRRWAEKVQKFSPLLGWLCPFIIVLVAFVLSRTALVEENMDAYADPATCFLTCKNNMIWSFAGPVVFVLGVNILILCKITHVVFKSSYSSNRLSAAKNTIKISVSLKRSLRGAIILMPILGIPTVVALLYNIYDDKTTESVGNDLKLIFGAMGAYLQVILAGVQGIAVFLFYCVCNDEVRSAHKLASNRRKSQSSLDLPLGKSGRKHSRIPLLFSRGDVTSEGTLSQSQSKGLKKSTSNHDFYQTTRRGTITSKDNVKITTNDVTHTVTYGRNLSQSHDHTIVMDL